MHPSLQSPEYRRAVLRRLAAFCTVPARGHEPPQNGYLTPTEQVEYAAYLAGVQDPRD